MITKEPRILYQGVDTLVTAHKATCKTSYELRFKPFLESLASFKLEAQLVNGFDKKSRYVIYEFPFIGKTKIYAQGGGRYSFLMENQDVFIEVSEADFESDTPQLRVKYYNHFLFFYKALGAYKKVLDFVSHFLGHTKNIISEIHLCTDVGGIVYEQEDKLRFQSRLNSSEYEDMRFFSAFNRVKGIYFGKGSFLFRIYDKNKDLQNHPEHSFVKQVWYLNGYSEFETDIVKKSVYRHEIQFRREYLKKYISGLEDEPLHFFEHLDKLWFHALEKVEFVNLTDDELTRVKTSIKTDTIRQIFYRAKRDDDRFSFWRFIAVWQNGLKNGSLDMYPAFREAKMSTLKKKIKEVVSLTARLGLTPEDLKNFVAEVDQKMTMFEGITLEQYGLLKVLDSFVQNDIQSNKFSVEAPTNMLLVKHSYDDLTQAFVNYDVISKRKEFRSASSHLGLKFT